jgi:hypothetical protein
MAFDEQTLAEIRHALERSERVDASRIDVTGGDGDDVVLRGSVSTHEEASTAAMLVEQHAPGVDNQLRVDPGIREDTTRAPEEPNAPRTEQDGSSQTRERPLAQDLSAQVQTWQPTETDDLTSDVDEALAENVAWDPPDTPSAPPTAAEQRGHGERDARIAAAAPEGPVDDPDEVAPSAADLSQAELERSAHPTNQNEEKDPSNG